MYPNKITLLHVIAFLEWNITPNALKMASNVCKIRVSSASSAVSSELTTYLQSYWPDIRGATSHEYDVT